MRLYFTDERPKVGWLISRQDDGTFRAEELDGPRAITAANLQLLVQNLAGDEAALQRKFTEVQVRQAATQAGCDADALATKLRALA
jgi:hypothetical protein